MTKRNSRVPCVGSDNPIRLREVKPADEPAITAMHQDERLSMMLMDDVSLDDAGNVEKFIQGLRRFYAQRPGLGFWIMERLETRYTHQDLLDQGALESFSETQLESLLKPVWQTVGLVNLTPVAGDEKRIELGMRLLPKAWGSPASLSVGDLVLVHAVEVLQLREIVIYCHPDNRSAQYCGFYLGFKEPVLCEHLGAPVCRLVLTAQHFLHWRSQARGYRKRYARQQCRQLCLSQPVIAARQSVPHGITL